MGLCWEIIVGFIIVTGIAWLSAGNEPGVTAVFSPGMQQNTGENFRITLTMPGSVCHQTC